MLKSNYIAKCYDQLGLYQKAYEFFEISNRISEELPNNNSDKKKFMDSIVQRTNYFSNFTNKITKKELNKSPNLDPVFLIGFPRSGTTLLDTILRTHSLIEVIEEKPIVDVIKKSLNYVDQVVVCDDGSSDLTSENAKSAGAVVIKHEKNMGKGHAMKTLFKYAKDVDADVVITIDGDGQFLPEQITPSG